MPVVPHTVTQGPPEECPDLYVTVKGQIFRLPRREINIQREAENDFRLVLLHIKVAKGEKGLLEREKVMFPFKMEVTPLKIGKQKKNQTKNRNVEREKSCEQELKLEV